MSFEQYTFRDFSTATKASMAAQSTDAVYLMLLKLNSVGFVAPLYFVNNNEDITSNAQVYTAFPFEISLPNEQPQDDVTKVQLQMYAQASIIEAVRGLSNPLTATLSVIVASEPDTMVAGPIELSVDDIEWDALLVRGNLRSYKLLDEPTPSDRFTPGEYATLF